MANTPKPITREDRYYDYLINGGDFDLLPKPIQRREIYLYYLCQNGFGGGGTVTPEQIDAAVERYFDENPIPKGEKGEKGDPGDSFAISKIYDDAEQMESDENPVEDGLLVAIISQNNALVYIRDSSLEIPGENDYPGYKYMTNLQDASVIRGEKGDAGEDAKINGQNTVSIVSGGGISISQAGAKLTIATDLGYLKKVTVSATDPAAVEAGELVLVYE